VAVSGDIASAAHRQAVAAAVADGFGRLDILVNNAGVCDDGPLEDQTLSELEAVVQVNLVAVLDLCRLMAPLLFSSEHASVINIASIYGLVASRGPMAAYNSTKAALVSLTRQLAAQWGPRRVRVNALAPGYFATELTGCWLIPPSSRISKASAAGTRAVHRGARRAVAVPGLGCV
jgi:NAD(P)-dependent dehydrogenase (short-subunit alcohol dehydrogenase family)